MRFYADPLKTLFDKGKEGDKRASPSLPVGGGLACGRGLLYFDFWNPKCDVNI